MFLGVTGACCNAHDPSMRVALVTSSDSPLLRDDDAQLTVAFAAAGAEARITRWDDEDVDWNTFDAAVLRNLGNYQKHDAALEHWCEQFEQLDTVLINEGRYLHRSYLHGLAHHGRIPSVGFQHIGNEPRVFYDLVAKPAVGPEGVGWVFVSETATQQEKASAWAAMHAHSGECIAQEFVPEIRDPGVLSCVFFGGVFSHAVIRKPKDGGFLVQEEMGGSCKPFTPSANQLTQLADFLERTHVHHTYVRIDVVETHTPAWQVRSGGEDRGLHLRLIEMQALDADLFFRHTHHGEARFAHAVVQAIRERRVK
jgi:hypothetical protein